MECKNSADGGESMKNTLLTQRKPMTPAPDEEDHLIDVVASFNCPRQSSRYNEAYKRWRETAPFAFRFYHNTKEHTYIDGLGFAQISPHMAERQSLTRNLLLLGMVLLLCLFLENVCSYLLAVSLNAFGLPIKWSLVNGFTEISQMGHMLADTFIRTIKIVLPMGMLVFITRLPKVVWCPLQVNSQSMHRMAMPMAVGIFVVQTFSQMFFSFATGEMGLESTYDLPASSGDNLPLWIMGVVGQVLLISVVREIFLGGIVLQFFRQYGNGFAILITSFVAGGMSHSLYESGFEFTYSVVICYFVLSTGSVWTGICMRMILRGLGCLNALIGTQLPKSLLDGIPGPISQQTINDYSAFLTVGLLLICGTWALIALFREVKRGGGLDNLPLRGTFMPMIEKCFCVLFSPSMAIWEVLSLILVLVTLQIKV